MLWFEWDLSSTSSVIISFYRVMQNVKDYAFDKKYPTDINLEP